MTTKVFFYLLNERFVENDEQVPEQAKQVMYYSLAIGHHVGVIDCFKKITGLRPRCLSTFCR